MSKVRKAVFTVGHYTIKEGPTGGWRVYVVGSSQPLSIHETSTDAKIAAGHYAAADKANERNTK
jgi:hypothetical protein